MVVAFVFRLRSDGESDNREPLSTISFGGAGPTKARVTTFGGLETTDANDPHVRVQVDIIQSDDVWKRSTTHGDPDDGRFKSASVVGHSEMEDQFEKIDLKVMRPFAHAV